MVAANLGLLCARVQRIGLQEAGSPESRGGADSCVCYSVAFDGGAKPSVAGETLMPKAAAKHGLWLLGRGGLSGVVRRSIHPRERVIAGSIILLGALVAPDYARSAPIFDTSEIASPQVTSGALTHARAIAVDRLIHRLRFADVDTQLAEVNRFFNRFEYRSDVDVWGKWDYWANPVEFVRRGAGDCEDFAISKYFMLRTLGVPDQNLAIAYVRDLRVNDWHMVLLYRSSSGGDSLVLDGRFPTIRPFARRPDLVPVYGFNATDVTILNRVGESRAASPVATTGHREWKRMLATFGLLPVAAISSETVEDPPRHDGHFVKAGFRQH